MIQKNLSPKYLQTDSGAEVYLKDIPFANVWPKPATYPSDAYMASLGYKRIYEEKPSLGQNQGYHLYTDEHFDTYVKRTWTVQQVLDDAVFLAKIKDAAKDVVAERRWRKETGGLDIGGGVIVKTDRESQASLNSAFTSLKNSLIPNTPWKAKNNVWTTLTLTEVEPLAAAVASFVRGTFAQEELYHQGIDACLTPQEVEDYLQGAIF